ncbi:MAG: hypothetical protein ACYC3X_06000 [Pirellulaceae bacterium]
MATKQTYTLAEIAARWGCCHSSVLMLVYSGDLRAIDISTNPKGKSRYIVPAEALEAFEAARATPPPEKPLKRKRVKVRSGEVIEFFS